jgi:hypothetical protein
MKKLLPVCFAGLLFFSACDDNNNEDQAKTVDKNGSVEVSLSTKHLNQKQDLLITHYTVWRKNEKVKEYDKRDTIPGLETFTTEGENDNGDTASVKVKKEYEFFVTVK